MPKQGLLLYVKHLIDVADRAASLYTDEKSNTTFWNTFSKQEYFSDLYVTVPTEEALKIKIHDETNGRLIALCGPAGSGKSTVTTKVLKDIEKDSRYKVVFIEGRSASGDKVNDDQDSEISQKQYRNIILESFYEEYTLYKSGILNDDRLSLYTFLLSPESSYQESRKHQRYATINLLSGKISPLYYDTKEENQNFQNWLRIQYISRNKEVRAILQEVDSELDVAHYLECSVNHLKRYERIVIWIDNLDAYSSIQQQQIVALIQDIQKTILAYCLAVISVREENIYRIGHHNDSINEPYLSEVSFVNPDNETQIEDRDRHSALNIPVMSYENLELMSRKLIQYTFKRYDSYIEHLAEYTGPHKEEKNRIKAEYEKFKVNQKNRTIVIDFISTLNNVFKDEKAIFLVNNSVKQYKQMLANFFKYILENDNNYSDGYFVYPHNKFKLTTEFLKWLHDVNYHYNIRGVNFFNKVKTNKVTGESYNEMYLPYLILTRTWNLSYELSNQLSPHNNPTVQKIVSDLINDFGFKESRILEELYLLHAHPQQRSNLITFRSKNVLSHYKQIDQTTTTRVTYRGKAAIGSVITTYGYSLACLLAADTTLKSHRDEDVTLKLIENLREVAELHLKSLYKYRILKNSPYWFNYYLSRYGIPMDKTFVRNPSLGYKLPGVLHERRGLFAQCLIASLLGYFQRQPKEILLLENYSAQYNKILDELIKNIPKSKEEIKIFSIS